MLQNARDWILPRNTGMYRLHFSSPPIEVKRTGVQSSLITNSLLSWTSFVGMLLYVALGIVFLQMEGNPMFHVPLPSKTK